MHEIKQKGTLATDDDFGMMATILIIYPYSWNGQQTCRLARSVKRIVRAIRPKTDVAEQIDQQPVMPAPIKR